MIKVIKKFYDLKTSGKWSLRQALSNLVFHMNTWRNKEACNFYQENCRIYLDEYKVEEWDYPRLFDNSFIMKRFMVKK